MTGAGAPEESLDLNGTWRAQVADDDLRRTFPDVGLDDSDWAELEVPSHWRSTADFASCDGPLFYRRRFEAPTPPPGRRGWLTFDGLFYQGDIWLDGAYLGDSEGYFIPHTFEVTDALADRTEHVLAVEATCTPQTDRSAKRNLTGVFQHWDCIDPDWNPGGIWRPVRLHHTGPVRIDRLRVLCRRADDREAVLGLRCELDAVDAGEWTIETTVGGIDHAETRTLAAGGNRLEWEVRIPDPALWWPRALGDQPLHDVTVRVRSAVAGDRDGDGDVSDEQRVSTGLRRVEVDRWVFRVNGERLFLKGSNQGPTRQDLGHATPDELRRDVQLAVDAGLDLLRVHAHVTRPEVYDAADEAGLLLWQDLPLQWGYARGIRKQAVRQARKAVDLLGHHPSIAIWCGHNEPLGISDTEVPTELGKMLRLGAKIVRHQQLPSWNRTVLDGSLKRALEKHDGTRPVVAHSGVWPHPPQLDGTDTHVYFGWYHGHERDFPTFCRTLPRMARFVTEFGAQAVPDNAEFAEPERWPDLDWEHLGDRHSLQKTLFDRHVPPAEHPTFDSWRDATQRYQATVIRHHVETLRRLKYRPTGGFAQFCFADSYPSVTWSVLDHERAPKAGFDALVAACRPVIVVADRPPESVAAGSTLRLAVHVVSDLRDALEGGRCEARLSWPGGEHRWRWGGDVAADAVAHVGTVEALVPDTPGRMLLDLTFTAGDVEATNRYETRIAPSRG